MIESCLTHLECARCGESHDAGQLQNLCGCGGPLMARYDMVRAAATLRPKNLASRRTDMWRYGEVLPVDGADIITLGEGMTPLVPLPRLSEALGMPRLMLKDEAANPTGSFKARGMAAAVSVAKKHGARTLATPTAGNAGGALAAYAARAGLGAVVVMPADAPEANKLEVKACGATLVELDGIISDCGRYVGERKDAEGWFDVSTLKEPYRVEGKKTLGYELFEQCGGGLPDAILYPTGGGVGLIGMWKAFDEMEQMGWVGSERPKMISVQAAGCAPIVKAFEAGEKESVAWSDAATLAPGLRVPKAFGDFIVLDAVYASGGAAVAASDEEILAAVGQLAESEGFFVCPEGGAFIAVVPALLASGVLKPDDRTVLFNTGSASKYMDVLLPAFASKQ